MGFVIEFLTSYLTGDLIPRCRLDLDSPAKTHIRLLTTLTLAPGSAGIPAGNTTHSHSQCHGMVRPRGEETGERGRDGMRLSLLLAGSSCLRRLEEEANS